MQLSIISHNNGIKLVVLTGILDSSVAIREGDQRGKGFLSPHPNTRRINLELDMPRVFMDIPHSPPPQPCEYKMCRCLV